MNRENKRRLSQLAFAQGNGEITISRAEDCPLPLQTLLAIKGNEPFITACNDSGLTARIFRIHADGKDWALKQARVPCLVKNIDGETSFLNELQRRRELRGLQQTDTGKQRFPAMIDTQYASYRQGILLSPWIDGITVQAWNERQLRQFFDQLFELLRAGFFEWDFSPGNILDDGRQLWFFDFGYMYRFDPLTEFNPNGLEAPLFHGAERFETRNYFAWLLTLEQTQGLAIALNALRLEKNIALQTYERLYADLQSRGAQSIVLEWLQAIQIRWRAALAGDLAALYWSEGWRSHRLDVFDDLYGQTCTPTTLLRIDWMLAVLKNHFNELQNFNAFFGEDKGLSLAQLNANLHTARDQALRWQIDPARSY